MKFFKKLFPNKKGLLFDSSNVGNGRLINLLETWHQDNTAQNSSEVIREIMFGESFLFLPFIDIDKTQEKWESFEIDTLFKLSSVFEYNKQRVVLAFTDSRLITPCLSKPAIYTSMFSVNVLNACKENNINKGMIYFGKEKPFVIGTAY